jgi:hypothetical protein
MAPVVLKFGNLKLSQHVVFKIVTNWQKMLFCHHKQDPPLPRNHSLAELKAFSNFMARNKRTGYHNPAEEHKSFKLCPRLAA